MATSYANNNGTGERRPEIIVTSDINSSNSDIGSPNTYTSDDLGIFVDGVTSGSLGAGGTGRDFGNANNGLDRKIQFDFGPGAAIVIDEFKLYLSLTTNFGTWTFEGSNNGSSWTTIGASFTLQASAGSLTVTRTNSTAYRYYRIHTTNFTNGVGGSGTWSEIEFKIEDTTPQTARTSWFNTGGKGNRTSLIDSSLSSITFSLGVVANLVDGDYTNNGTHAVTLSTGQTAAFLEWDFGSGASVVIDTIVFWLSTSAGNANGTWKLQGSANGSSWTDLESASNLLDTNNHYTLHKRTVVNTTGYRYYRLLQTSGTTATPTILEIEFRTQGAAGGGGGGGAKTVIIIGSCG